MLSIFIYFSTQYLSKKNRVTIFLTWVTVQFGAILAALLTVNMITDGTTLMKADIIHGALP